MCWSLWSLVTHASSCHYGPLSFARFQLLRRVHECEKENPDEVGIPDRICTLGLGSRSNLLPKGLRTLVKLSTHEERNLAWGVTPECRMKGCAKSCLQQTKVGKCVQTLATRFCTNQLDIETLYRDLLRCVAGVCLRCVFKERSCVPSQAPWMKVSGADTRNNIETNLTRLWGRWSLSSIGTAKMEQTLANSCTRKDRKGANLLPGEKRFDSHLNDQHRSDFSKWNTVLDSILRCNTPLSVLRAANH